MKNLVLIAVIVFAVVILAFALYTTTTSIYGQRYQNAVSSELDDICATPSGYTTQAWTEHMNHHPDRYAGCPGVR